MAGVFVYGKTGFSMCYRLILNEDDNNDDTLAGDENEDESSGSEDSGDWDFDAGEEAGVVDEGPEAMDED